MVSGSDSVAPLQLCDLGRVPSPLYLGLLWTVVTQQVLSTCCEQAAGPGHNSKQQRQTLPSWTYLVLVLQLYNFKASRMMSQHVTHPHPWGASGDIQDASQSWVSHTCYQGGGGVHATVYGESPFHQTPSLPPLLRNLGPRWLTLCLTSADLGAQRGPERVELGFEP